jgi:hypothetical protein
MFIAAHANYVFIAAHSNRALLGPRPQKSPTKGRSRFPGVGDLIHKLCQLRLKPRNFPIRRLFRRTQRLYLVQELLVLPASSVSAPYQHAAIVRSRRGTTCHQEVVPHLLIGLNKLLVQALYLCMQVRLIHQHFMLRRQIRAGCHQ